MKRPMTINPFIQVTGWRSALPAILTLKLSLLTHLTSESFTNIAIITATIMRITAYIACTIRKLGRLPSMPSIP